MLPLWDFRHLGDIFYETGDIEKEYQRRPGKPRFQRVSEKSA